MPHLSLPALVPHASGGSPRLLVEVGWNRERLGHRWVVALRRGGLMYSLAMASSPCGVPCTRSVSASRRGSDATWDTDTSPVPCCISRWAGRRWVPCSRGNVCEVPLVIDRGANHAARDRAGWLGLAVFCPTQCWSAALWGDFWCTEKVQPGSVRGAVYGGQCVLAALVLARQSSVQLSVGRLPCGDPRCLRHSLFLRR